LDRYDQQRKNVKKWKVSGSHGHFYPWAIARDFNAGPRTAVAEVNVKDFVYRQLIDLISAFIPDLEESPAYPDDMMDGGTDPTTLKVRY
jgi:hypothetical protein